MMEIKLSDEDMARLAESVTNKVIDKIMSAPQLTMPPVLRWEGSDLKIYKAVLASTFSDVRGWGYSFPGVTAAWFKNTEQEARRAAEKALGFPDRIVVEEV